MMSYRKKYQELRNQIVPILKQKIDIETIKKKTNPSKIDKCLIQLNASLEFYDNRLLLDEIDRGIEEFDQFVNNQSDLNNVQREIKAQDGVKTLTDSNANVQQDNLEIEAKTAYFDLLMQCFNVIDIGRDMNKLFLNFRSDLISFINFRSALIECLQPYIKKQDQENNNDNREEFLFVHLFQRSQAIQFFSRRVPTVQDLNPIHLLEKPRDHFLEIITDVKDKFLRSEYSLNEANYLLTKEIDDNLPQMKNKTLPYQLIISYFNQLIDAYEADEFCQAVFNSPSHFKMEDYLFYHSPFLKERKQTTFFEMMQSLARDDLPDKNQVDSGYKNTKGQNITIDATCDNKLYRNYIPAFHAAINKAYKKLSDNVKDKKRKSDLEKFVNDLSDFSGNILKIQAQLQVLKDPIQYLLIENGRANDSDEIINQRKEKVEDAKKELQITAVKINTEVKALKDDMNRLFKAGHPKGRLLKAAGIALGIISIGIMIAGIALSIVPPVGAFCEVVGFSMMMASDVVTAGGFTATFLVGTGLFAAGKKMMPSKTFTTTKDIIAYGEEVSAATGLALAQSVRI